MASIVPSSKSSMMPQASAELLDVELDDNGLLECDDSELLDSELELLKLLDDDDGL